MANVLIKNINPIAYKKAKIFAVKQEKNVGEVVTEAILFYLSKKRKKGLAGLKPMHFGQGTENLSTNIDEILDED